jgi:hypothetical protein
MFLPEQKSDMAESGRGLEFQDKVGTVESGCDHLKCVTEISDLSELDISCIRNSFSGPGEKFAVDQCQKCNLERRCDLHSAPFREESHQTQTFVFSREPSFIYDTTVEAFGNRGAKSLDDLDLIVYTGSEEEDDKDEENDETEPVGISVIGKLVLSLDDVSKSYEETNDVQTAFLEATDSSGATRVSVTNISCIAEEKPQQKYGILIPTQRQRHSHMGDCKDGSGGNSVDEKEEAKISSTPEAEAYFYRREQSFIKKAEQGELAQLAVVVSDYFSQLGMDTCSEGNEQEFLPTTRTSVDHKNLTVKPVLTNPEAEIEITGAEDISDSASNLIVKTVGSPTAAGGLLSSYESIYDRLLLEEVETGMEMETSGVEHANTTDMVQRRVPVSAASLVLGDRFCGMPHQLPDWAGSSFQELYDQSATALADSILAAATLDAAAEPLDRWSAPAGTLEPPIMDAGNFFMRFDPVQERIEGHWQELEILMKEDDVSEAKTSDL